MKPKYPKTVLSMSDDIDYERDTGVAVAEAKPELSRPRRYQVVMLNDDYTPMEFVVEALEYFFGHSREAATKIMLSVHNEGKGICGVFVKDIAETKAEQVNQFARANEHPLLCDIEPIDDSDDE